MNRVLIIAYFFPPVSNMGSHRILRFVRHLGACGWEPHVLTGATPGWTLTDSKLLAQLPAGARVHRVAGLDLTELWQRLRGRTARAQPATPAPVTTQGLTTFLNRWVMVPDKYFPWINPAVHAGQRLIREHQITAIYSTSDPLSDHLVGRRLARWTGVPWVAEFRDLWLGSPYFARAHPTPLHRAWHARLERQVVHQARAVVALSGGIQRYFETTYPDQPVRSLYNCFEPEDYGAAIEPAATFRVLYAGALYSSRSPEPFLAGFADFVRRQSLTPAEAEFVWLGGSSDLDVPAMVARLALTPYVRLGGNVRHADALREMQAATVLLTIQSPEDAIHVPGKLFEYIGARRPILAVARPCEVAEIVRTHALGWVAEPQADAIRDRLTELYRLWQTRGHAGLQIQAADRFSSHAATRQLAALLTDVVSGAIKSGGSTPANTTTARAGASR